MKKIKILFFSIVDVIMLMMVSTIISVIASFVATVSTSTIFFFVFPIAVIVRFYSMNSEIKPMKAKIEYLEKENDSKDQIIKRFLTLQDCD